MSEIAYVLRRSKRSGSIRISIHGRDEVIVSAPSAVSERFIKAFVASKSGWVEGKLEKLKKLPEHVFIKSSVKDFKAYKEAALWLAERRLVHFNAHYALPFKKISIRNQKSRWGSCSRAGTLSFSYKIALLPPHLADYIIVHELCHLKEMNHSKRFWALVAETISEYPRLRAELNGKRQIHEER